MLGGFRTKSINFKHHRITFIGQSHQMSNFPKMLGKNMFEMHKVG